MASQPPPQDQVNPADPSQNPPQAAEEQPADVPLIDPRLPTRKDTSLRDFLSKIDDYAPIVRAILFPPPLYPYHKLTSYTKQIPEGVTNYYMTKAGLPPPPYTDPRLARLLALATQKFIADIAADAYQYSRIRASNSSAANNPMGNLGAAAGYPIPGAPGGVPGMAGGVAGAKPGVAGGAGAAAGGQLLGIQRPGYGGGGQGGSQNRTVLTMEDLGMAVGEYGVNVKRSEFYR